MCFSKLVSKDFILTKKDQSCCTDSRIMEMEKLKFCYKMQVEHEKKPVKLRAEY